MIKENSELYDVPGFGKQHGMNFEFARPTPMQKQLRDKLNMPAATVTKLMSAAGAKPLIGYQLRYIYFLDPTARERLTVPILPFSEIDRRGAGMYKGKPRVRGVDSDTSGDQPEEGGANPTRTLSGDQP